MCMSKRNRSDCWPWKHLVRLFHRLYAPLPWTKLPLILTCRLVGSMRSPAWFKTRQIQPLIPVSRVSFTQQWVPVCFHSLCSDTRKQSAQSKEWQRCLDSPASESRCLIVVAQVKHNTSCWMADLNLRIKTAFFHIRFHWESLDVGLKR